MIFADEKGSALAEKVWTSIVKYIPKAERREAAQKLIMMFSGGSPQDDFDQWDEDLEVYRTAFPAHVSKEDWTE